MGGDDGGLVFCFWGEKIVKVGYCFCCDDGEGGVEVDVVYLGYLFVFVFIVVLNDCYGVYLEVVEVDIVCYC